MKRKIGIPKKRRFFLLAGGAVALLLAGCGTLPDGNPPSGPVTRNPSGARPLSFPEAVNRIVTECSVAGLAAGAVPFSKITAEGEPREVVLAAARELGAPESGFLGRRGPVWTLHGERRGQRVVITLKTDRREVARFGFLMK